MKDVVKEVERMVEEIRKLVEMVKVECDSEDVDCMIKKGVAYIQLRKRVDKMVYQLAFGYVTANILEKEMIEQVVDALVKLKLITEQRWMKAVADVTRYVNKIDGIDTRMHIRRVADRLSDGGMI